MNSAQIQQLIGHDFFKKITAMRCVEEIFVFGSMARGDADADSDIDLAITCPTATDEEWEQIQTISRQASLLVFVDCVRLDKEKPGRFRQWIIKERIPIYFRDRGGDQQLLAGRLMMIEEKAADVTHANNHLRTLVSTQHPASADPRQHPAFLAYGGTFKQTWLMARQCLKLHGARVYSPAMTFREAYAEGWIANRTVWEQMIEDFVNVYEPRETAEGKMFDVAAFMARLPDYTAAIADFCDAARKLLIPFEQLVRRSDPNFSAASAAFKISENP